MNFSDRNNLYVPDNPADSYIEVARFDLVEEFKANEDGVLEDAFDGELFEPLRRVGKILAAANPKTDAEILALAIVEFRRQVNAAASSFADRHAQERAESLAEDANDPS